MNGVPDAIFHLPDGTEIKCQGLFISPSYAAALAKRQREVAGRLCEGCAAGRHCRCGMQSWCECDCDGTPESCGEECPCSADSLEIAEQSEDI